MKNIQIIDGADNCTYSIFSVPDEIFREIFPNETDIEFIDDFIKRVGEDRATEISNIMWSNPAAKRSVCGIHGTIFYELDFKRRFYPTKKEAEMVALGI